MSNSIARKMERAKMEKVKMPSAAQMATPSMNTNVLTMTLPRTLVVDVDNGNVYLGEDNRQVSSLQPILKNIHTKDDLKIVRDWSTDNADQFDKVVMQMTPPPKEGEESKSSFKVQTHEEFLQAIDSAL